MTAPRLQCHFWQHWRSVFFFFRILGGAQREELPKSATRSSDGDFTHGIWSPLELTALVWSQRWNSCYRRIEQSARKFARSRQRGAEKVNPGKKSLDASVLVQPARPLGCLLWKSVRTPLISAPQQTEMTAADSCCHSVFKPAVRTWLV